MELKENETLEDLLIDGLKIIQSKDLYRFSSDAVLLSKFASFKKGDKVMDLCAGSGIIGLHFYALHKDVKSVKEVEIQSELADICKRIDRYFPRNSFGCQKVALPRRKILRMPAYRAVYRRFRRNAERGVRAV